MHRTRLVLTIALAVLAVGAASARGDIISGLLGRWTLDQSTGTNASNAAGNPNGTLANFTFDASASRGALGTTHRVGFGSLEFDKAADSNDYVTMGTSLQIPNTMTIAAWVNPDSFPGAGTRFYVTGRMGGAATGGRGPTSRTTARRTSSSTRAAASVIWPPARAWWAPAPGTTWSSPATAPPRPSTWKA